MRQQLIQYVDLLFAGAPQAADIRQEILQNTLDRYDDLIAQGKSPEAAYSLAISGIGDISELLGDTAAAQTAVNTVTHGAAPFWKKLLRIIAICLYILCPIPLFVLSELGMETIGLCGLLAIVAVATAMMIISSSEKKTEDASKEVPLTPQQELRNSVQTGINTIGFVLYFVLSFLTQAWWITWLIFPIMGAVNGLVKACMDLKGVSKHEN